jgi:hypothetical protein
VRALSFLGNILFVVGGVCSGFTMLSADSIRRSNAGPVFSFLVLVSTAVFVFWYCRYAAENRLLVRPSIWRFSVLWWRDPLQSLFLTTGVSAGAVIGAGVRLPFAGGPGLWLFLSLLSALLGLLAGQAPLYVGSRELFDKT